MQQSLNKRIRRLIIILSFTIIILGSAVAGSEGIINGSTNVSSNQSPTASNLTFSEILVIPLANVTNEPDDTLIAEPDPNQNISGYTPNEGTESIISVATWDTRQDYPALWEDRIVWADRKEWSEECSCYQSDIYWYNLTSGQQLRINTDSSDQIQPDIWGNRIVWEDNRNQNQDIGLFNLESGEEILIVNDSYPQIHPAIWGRWAVWEDWRDDQYYIWLYDTETGENRRISSADTFQFNPAIWEDRVVYEDWRNGNSDIYLYNLTEDKEYPVVTDPGEQVRPAIWGDVIVWTDNREGTYQIYLQNFGNNTELKATKGPGPYDFAAIHGNLVVYVNQTGYYDIEAFDIVNGTTVMITDSVESAQMDPDIWGDRVVWWDGRNVRDNQDYDIYLFTFSISKPPLIPEFSANNTLGEPPFAVRFNDLTSGSVDGIQWYFGDGNISTEKNPVYVYPMVGTYSVTLLVHNPYQRNATKKTDYISVGSVPIPKFSANITSGPAPLAIRFNDTSSGLPTVWSWDFGEGNLSPDQNPVNIYNQPGVYDVKLTAGNIFGNNSLEKPVYITVMDGTYNHSFLTIDGITVTESQGSQMVKINTSQISCIFNPQTNSSQLQCFPPDVRGYREIVLYSMDGTGFSYLGNDTIFGNLTGIVLKSVDITPTHFSQETGSATWFNYTLQPSRYSPEGRITTIIWEGKTSEDYSRFDQTAMRYNYAGITGTAYTIRFDEEEFSSTGPATLIFGVNSDWVKKYGWGDHGTLNITSVPEQVRVYVDGTFAGFSPLDVDNLAPGPHNVLLTMAGYEDLNCTMVVRDERESIHVIRIGDDGTGEVLPAEYIYHDPGRNLDLFRIESPQGLSTFGITALYKSGSPIQMLYLTLSRTFGGGGGGGSGSPHASPAGGGGGRIVESPVGEASVLVPAGSDTASSRKETVPQQSGSSGSPQTSTEAGLSPDSYSSPSPQPSQNQPLPGFEAGMNSMVMLRNLAIVFAVIFIAIIFYVRWRKLEE